MKILLAVEGSEFSNAALAETCKLFGNTPGLEIKIVSAVAPIYVAAEPLALSAAYTSEMVQAEKKAAEDVVARAEADVRKALPGLAGISTQVTSGPAARVIVEEAADWAADLIVVGSHGYGFWQRSLLGSVSNSVVHHAPCSVLVVRTK